MAMTLETSHISFGRYLKTRRLEKGFSLDDISWETRIGRNVLERIENEDHERLPVEVYVKGFIRAYAEMVGADPEGVIQSYSASRREFLQNKCFPKERRPSGPFWSRLTVGLGILLVIIGGTVCLMSALNSGPVQQRSNSDTTAVPPAPSRTASRLSAPVAVPASPGGDSAPAAGSTRAVSYNVSSQPPPPSSGLLLKMEALEETWIKIIVDNQPAREYTLKSGDRMALEAAEGYNLLIGKAGGIKFFLNDKPIHVPGKNGEVVNLQLP